MRVGDTRWILLGASNAERGGVALLDAMRTRAGGPVALHAAIGRGRSYGIRSRVLVRGLGGILDAPIWAATAHGDPQRTKALVMDVGNDLFYGVPVPLVLAWVDLCLQRLRERASELTVVGIPLAALARLRPWQFGLFRRVLVPECRLDLAEGLRQARQLHDGLQALAARHGARFVAVEDAWYGFDPIHVRRRRWGAAAAVLAGGESGQESDAVRGEAGGEAPHGEAPNGMAPHGKAQHAEVRATTLGYDGLKARVDWLLARPAERTWLGRAQVAAQPTRCYGDGSTVAFW